MQLDATDLYSQPPTTAALTSTSVQVYELPPRPKVVYDKSIQTSDELYLPSTSSIPSTSFSTSPSSSSDPNTTAGGVGRETAEEMRSRIVLELEEERRKLDLEIEEEKKKAEEELEEERKKGLDESALSSVLASPPFLDFLNSSSKIVQRALSDSYDYLRDYTVSSVEDGKGEDGARVRLLGSWYEERWGRGRSVTGVEWSPKAVPIPVKSSSGTPVHGTPTPSSKHPYPPPVTPTQSTPSPWWVPKTLTT
ncbi:hypothetical protein P7C70_g322, partial [Phenoliferia sp. Uapishka_3]